MHVFPAGQRPARGRRGDADPTEGGDREPLLLPRQAGGEAGEEREERLSRATNDNH